MSLEINYISSESNMKTINANIVNISNEVEEFFDESELLDAFELDEDFIFSSLKIKNPSRKLKVNNELLNPVSALASTLSQTKLTIPMLDDETKKVIESTINFTIRNKYLKFNIYTLMYQALLSPTGQQFCKKFNIDLCQLNKKYKTQLGKSSNDPIQSLVNKNYYPFNLLPLLKKLQSKDRVDINLLLLSILIVNKNMMMNFIFPNGFNKITKQHLAHFLLGSNLKENNIATTFFVFKLDKDNSILSNSNHPDYIENYIPKSMVDEVFLLCMENELKNKSKAYQEYQLAQSYFKDNFNTLLNNTSLSFYKRYYIEFIKDETKHNYDNRVKPFVAAGTCYYDSKISMNINEINHSKKWGALWAKHCIKNIFFHELGHAVDAAWHYQDFLTYPSSDKNNAHSHIYTNNKYLENINKKCFKKFKKLNKKGKEKFAYYVKPGIQDKMIENVAYKISKDLPNISKTLKRKYLYSRSKCEGFAECFSKIIVFLLNGYDESIYFAETRKKSMLRGFVALMKPMLLYLLEHIDWEQLGVPKRNLVMRKIEFRRMVEHLSTMPESNPNSTEYSPKVHRRKKMLRNRYQ